MLINNQTRINLLVLSDRLELTTHRNSDRHFPLHLPKTIAF
ncbi:MULTISPECIES: hypothetical protein [unclassified Microcoleus]|nr:MULTISPECIES: hypothetical protein [unclassified Microcoleus]